MAARLLSGKKKAMMLRTMSDGEPHWFDEWTDTSNKRHGQWAIAMRELEAEGVVERAGVVKACGYRCQDGRGKPRIRYRLTEYGKEYVDELIARYERI